MVLNQVWVDPSQHAWVEIVHVCPPSLVEEDPGPILREVLLVNGVLIEARGCEILSWWLSCRVKHRGLVIVWMKFWCIFKFEASLGRDHFYHERKICFPLGQKLIQAHFIEGLAWLFMHIRRRRRKHESDSQRVDLISGAQYDQGILSATWKQAAQYCERVFNGRILKDFSGQDSGRYLTVMQAWPSLCSPKSTKRQSLMMIELCSLRGLLSANCSKWSYWSI